jgi:hypothetical protein
VKDRPGGLRCCDATHRRPRQPPVRCNDDEDVAAAAVDDRVGQPTQRRLAWDGVGANGGEVMAGRSLLNARQDLLPSVKLAVEQLH